MNSVEHSPVRGAQSRSEPSNEPVATVFPSGENPPQETDALCPANTCISAPSAAFHIHAVKSSDPASSTLPLGCHRTHSSPPPGPSSARGGAAGSATDQTSALPSSPPDASRDPSWLNDRLETVSVWPRSAALVTSAGGAEDVRGADAASETR